MKRSLTKTEQLTRMLLAGETEVVSSVLRSAYSADLPSPAEPTPPKRLRRLEVLLRRMELRRNPFGCASGQVLPRMQIWSSYIDGVMQDWDDLSGETGDISNSIILPGFETSI